MKIHSRLHVETNELELLGETHGRGSGSHSLKLTQVNRVAAPHRPRQKEYGFLQVGGQPAQVQDLRDPSPGHVPEPGQLGIVGDDTGLDQLLQAERQGQQARYAGHAAKRHRSWWREPVGLP
jgi:hypothetical protein